MPFIGTLGQEYGLSRVRLNCGSGSSSFFQHSTTLGSVVAGGLGDYGSDESEDEDERSVRGSESSDTDEEELHHRIREKQDAFRRKEREMFLLQEKQAQDALLARGETLFFYFTQNPFSQIKMNKQIIFISFLRRDGKGEVK